MKESNKSQKRSHYLRWIFIFLVMTLVVSGQLLIRAENHSDDTEELYRFYDTFTEAFLKIKETYVEDVDNMTLLNGALKGMLNTLDDHSQYLNPDALEELQKDTGGEFSGIGIHIGIRNGILTVIAPIPGSPSAKLGILPWDRIIEIEGESTEGITVMEAVKKLTGPQGTQVTITVFRKGEQEPLYFTITRANIVIRSVYHKVISDDIGYVRLARFSENTTPDLKKALLDFKEKDVKGVILDLRFNSGGLLSSAVEVSNFFVPKGEVIVSTKGRLPSQNSEFLSSDEPILDVPLIVLINQASASASEIVAGAIKDHKLGILLGPKGQTTFGKGSVQSIEQLDNILQYDKNGNEMPAAIRVTTAKYYTPSGATIHNKGIKPDVEVELPEKHEEALLRHGLLGEPTQDIPDDKTVSEEDIKEFKENGILKNNNDNENEKLNKEVEEPDSDVPEKEGEQVEENGGGKQETDDTFVDVQLNEAVKLLRSILIVADRFKA